MDFSFGFHPHIMSFQWPDGTLFQGFGCLERKFKDWIYKVRVDQCFCMDWIKVFHRRPDGSEGFSGWIWRFPVFSKICFYT
jgi:hypothetical protein